MFAFALVLAPLSEAASDIEFKSSSPVSIYVDGQQASQPNPLKHRASALDPGVHQLKVVGMFGKTLYEAEIDLPDNTITYAAWERGEIKVLSTDWLPKEEEEATAEVPDDTGSDEEELEVVEVPPPAPVEATEAEAPPEPMAENAGQDAVASVDPSGSPASPTGNASATGAGEASGAGAATTAAVAAGGVAAGMALDDTNDPAAPVTDADSALTTAPVAQAAATTTTAAPAPVARTLKVQAADGMRIEIVHGGQTITVVVKAGEFLIEDGTGFSMALTGTPAPPPAQP